jgi:hypothetical protein
MKARDFTTVASPLPMGSIRNRNWRLSAPDPTFIHVVQRLCTGMNGGSNMEHKPRAVESSVALLRGVRMSRDRRELAIASMKRSEALVDLAFRCGAGIKPQLHRLVRSSRGLAKKAGDLIRTVPNHH